MAMKKPMGLIETMQEQIDVGLNAFGAQLLAESYSDKPELFKGRTLILRAHNHRREDVYIIIGTGRPTIDQFDNWPEWTRMTTYHVSWITELDGDLAGVQAHVMQSRFESRDITGAVFQLGTLLKQMEMIGVTPLPIGFTLTPIKDVSDAGN